MPSPFPGMDPYLEGHVWPDTNNSLAYIIKKMLAPQIAPGYIARMATYTVQDTEPQEDVGIMYPDVEVMRKPPPIVSEPAAAYGPATVITPPTVTIASPLLIEVRIPVIEIRDKERNQLVTAIEILSPVNKRKPGYEPYQAKRRKLHENGVHLLEIDLIRRGKRWLDHQVPPAHYVVTLRRKDSSKNDVWAMGVKDALPVVPVPLKAPDKDVVLDLQKALNEVYDESLYGLSVNYKADPPPPAFSKEEMIWMKNLFKEKMA